MGMYGWRSSILSLVKKDLVPDHPFGEGGAAVMLLHNLFGGGLSTSRKRGDDGQRLGRKRNAFAAEGAQQGGGDGAVEHDRAIEQRADIGEEHVPDFDDAVKSSA